MALHGARRVSRLDRLFAFLAHHPLLVASAVALLVGGLVSLAYSLRGDWRPPVDASIERLLPARASDRAAFERTRKLFGESEPVLVAADLGAPVFSAAGLAGVDAVNQRLSALAGVVQVQSLATAPVALAETDTDGIEALTVLPAPAWATEQPARLPEVAAAVRADPALSGLVAADGHHALWLLTLARPTEESWRAGGYTQSIPAAVAAGLAMARGGRPARLAEPVHVTGALPIRAATTDALVRSLDFTTPTVLIVIVLVLVLAFRDLRAVLAGVVAIGITGIAVLALARLFGIAMNMLTALAPPLILTQALCYAIHLLQEFRDPDHADPAKRLRAAALPLLLNAATSSAGFLALEVNDLPAIRQFGLLSAMGVVISAFVTLLVVPALTNLTRAHRNNTRRAESLYHRAGEVLARITFERRKMLLAGAGLLTVVGLAFATQLEVHADFIGGFRENTPVRADYEFINRQFGGANVVNVLIQTPVGDALTQPEVSQAVDSLQEWLKHQPEVGGAYSYLDVVRALNRELGSGRSEVPTDATLVRQLILLGGGDALKPLADARLSSARIVLRLKVDDARTILNFQRRVKARFETLPPAIKADLTGTPILAARTIQEITAGQWQSVALALVLIWGMLAVLFLSARAATLAVIPNLVPVAFYFGFLAATGIGLSPATCLIASVVLGISVDDTIHFMTRFSEDARQLGSERQAAAETLSHVLRPMTLTMLALCGGFLVFLGSDLKSQQQFGWLAALTLFVSWLVEIFLTPALAGSVRIVTLWDALRVDLGEDPARTIPLFAGLSVRQARLFALTARLEHLPAGAQLIREGDTARDMFVLVEGALEVSVQQQGKKRLLTRLGRGVTLGEAGYFGQKRTADVTTITPVRLLRFDLDDLERLRVRHSRIAATLFRNLNTIQSERLARMTRMLAEARNAASASGVSVAT